MMKQVPVHKDMSARKLNVSSFIVIKQIPEKFNVCQGKNS